jgi:hypothetical protein
MALLRKSLVCLPIGLAFFTACTDRRLGDGSAPDADGPAPESAVESPAGQSPERPGSPEPLYWEEAAARFAALEHGDACTGTPGPIAWPSVASGPLARLVIQPTTSPRIKALAWADGTHRTDLRILLLTAAADRPAFQAALVALDRLAVPHETLVAGEQALTAERLIAADGTCRYRGVIVSELSLPVYDSASGTWGSALSADEWSILANFEQQCGAREAVWYAWPSPEIGMAYDSSIPGTNERAVVTSEGTAQVWPYVQANQSIPISGVWGYRGTVLDPTTTRSVLEAEGGLTMGVVHRRPDGREVLALTVDSSQFSLHSAVLEFGVINWLHHGMFVGQRRVYLNPQVDDVFLATDMWVPGGGEATFRISGDDLRELSAWQADFQSRLPAGSSYRTTMAFNGIGATSRPEYEPSLLAAFVAEQLHYGWLNHTWDHENMDHMRRPAARREIARNCNLAATYGMPWFSCTEAVTPQVSGLENRSALEGMSSAGVKYVVSDTSITPALNPDNPGTNPSFNTGRYNPTFPAIFQVPRHPTNIFFNCSVPEEEVDLYNVLYQGYFGRALSYDELLEIDTEFGMRYMVSGDIDPLMFHQANLRFWTGDDGKRHSLFTDWIERAVARYLELMNLPIQTLTMSEIAQRMLEREQLNRCAPAATLVEDAAGSSLELVTTAACRVPITGLAADAGHVEIYGGQPTTTVNMTANSVRTIPLP